MPDGTEVGYARGMMTGLPPGHIPMVMLTPEQYQILNANIHRYPYFHYAVMTAAAQGVQDFIKAVIQGAVIDKRKGELPGIANTPMDLSFRATNDPKLADLAELSSEVLKKLGDNYLVLLDAWKAGIGAGMGSSIAQWGEQFMATGQLVYAYSVLQYQTSVIPRMRRYWMSEYTPAVPDASMAWILQRRKIIDNTKFEEYASYDGWDKKGIEFLRRVWYNLPNENTAFRMYMRGVIGKIEKESLYYANSWESNWFNRLDAIYQWLPNASEAFTLFKRGAIKEAHMYSLMQAHGFMPDYQKLLPRLYERSPLPRDAFNMYMREAITEDDFDKYVEANEWEEGSAERLWAIYQNLPNSREAFTLFRRGKINEAALTALFKADGYMPTYQKIVSSLYERIPLPRDAFNALMRGYIDKKKFDSYIYQNEWQEGMADFLYEIYTRLPSANMAFYMWKKGLINLARRDELYKAAGYDNEWFNILTANFEYIPTVYDLTRIADYVEVDTIWATEVLKMRGLRDRDISKIIAMLKIRPLRDEIRRQLTVWVNRYSLGWATATQLEEAFQEYLEDGYIQSTEKTLLTEEAELKYEDELMREKIDIYSWYFRTAVITEEELLEDFLDLGIREEKANLMVELLKAQGYYGYY